MITPVKLLVLAILGFLLGGGSFACGLVAGSKKLLPYMFVYNFVDERLEERRLTATASRLSDAVIGSTLVSLHTSITEWSQGAPTLGTGGGGLTAFGDQVIGVDKWGAFFVYSHGGRIDPLDLVVETNIDDLRHVAVRREQSTASEADLIATFRFLDIAASELDGQVTIFVSYYYWYPAERCKAIRLARLAVDSREQIEMASIVGKPSDWEVVFESYPCLEFSYADKAAFHSVRSGGSLAFDQSGGLLLTLGDHHLDGYNNRDIAAQDDRSDYGKLIRIDPETLTVERIAKGLRNSAVMVDGRGRIWVTDHGPKGGDELNLIHPGGNYGWPFATFGTQYGEHVWELNPRQGRHEGYDLPVYAWLPAIGISRLLKVDGVPRAWRGDLLVSSLKAGTLFRLRLQNDRVVSSEAIRIGERIRDMVQMTDGTVLLWTDSGKLIELTAGASGSLLEEPQD